jgi:hypothetical protein
MMVPDIPTSPEPPPGLADLCNACDRQLVCPSAYVHCAWVHEDRLLSQSPEQDAQSWTDTKAICGIFWNMDYLEANRSR